MFAFIGKFFARNEISALKGEIERHENRNYYATLDADRHQRNLEKVQEALRQERELRLVVVEAAKNGLNIYQITGFVNSKAGTTRINEFLAAESQQAAKAKAEAKHPRELIGSRVLTATQVPSTIELKLTLESDPMEAVANQLFKQMLADIAA